VDDAAAYSPDFEAGLERKTLLFPKCRACGGFHWYPMPRCPHCRSEEVEWTATTGTASIFTYTTVHHAFDHKWKSGIPYTVALVEFSDAPGIRLVSQLVSDPANLPVVGSVVEPVFDLAGKRPRVLFRITSGTE
jgi:uncharacterized protein